MLAVIVVIFVSSSILLTEIPYLVKKGNSKDIWVFSITLLFTTGLGIAVVLHVKIPNPIDWISVIYQPLSDLVLHVLM